ncbi:MAG: hypothetical protein HC771_20510 [Synechococcales cyanobacterium CRU_2_2]|nr:hypothetical protein [Synechococcales cyanobacterium CRU_2_2]
MAQRAMTGEPFPLSLLASALSNTQYSTNLAERCINTPNQASMLFEGDLLNLGHSREISGDFTSPKFPTSRKKIAIVIQKISIFSVID